MPVALDLGGLSGPFADVRLGFDGLRIDLSYMLVHDQDLHSIFILSTFQRSKSEVQRNIVRCGRSDSRRLGRRLPRLYFSMRAFGIRLQQVHRRSLR